LCAAPEASPKIQALVDQISGLTLLEASELTDALKEKLGISGAMMMPAGGGGGGGAAPAAAAEAEEAAPEKLIFTIKLAKFDAATKIKLIKEVRSITGLGLKEAKELVEKAPSDVKVDVKKEEAEEIKKKLEEVGGTVELL
jgi:large subunit ribosomal protein L7/L12